MSQLLAYAKSNNNQHLCTWLAFNKAVGSDGTEGVWHETYHVNAGTYENIYVNMPSFGLSEAGNVVLAVPQCWLGGWLFEPQLRGTLA